MRLQLHTTGIEPVTYSLQILRHTMVAAIVQTRLYVFGRSIDFDFDRCRGQFVSTRPMPIPLNFGIAASLVLTPEGRSKSRRPDPRPCSEPEYFTVHTSPRLTESHMSHISRVYRNRTTHQQGWRLRLNSRLIALAGY